MKRIHIVGSGPRTGTTLIAEVMVACFDIDQHSEHEDRIFKQPLMPGKIYLTKCPQDILVAEPILKADPNLYIICMIRDPRDTIVSKHAQDPQRYWVGLKCWKTYIPYWRRIRSHSRVITVMYEEFVSDPDKIQHYLMEKMPFLQFRAPFSHYHELAKPSSRSSEALGEARPISPKSVGNWKNNLSRVKNQLQLHGSITNDLIEFGYEKDELWVDQLNGIEPCKEESHWPEFFTKKRIREIQRGRYRHALKIYLYNTGIVKRMRNR